MTVESTHCVVSYDGNDVRTDFPTTFRFLDEEHLVVETSDDDGATWTTLVLGDGYEVDGAGDAEPGGTVTTTDPVATGTTLRITRDTSITQLNSFRSTGPVPVATIETSFDKLTMIAQEERYRLEQLEALGDLVTVTELADAAIITPETFTASDPPEDTFEMLVTVAGGDSASFVLWKVSRTDLEPMTEAAEVTWSRGFADNLFIQNITGLEPGIEYVVTGLVFFT